MKNVLILQFAVKKLEEKRKIMFKMSHYVVVVAKSEVVDTTGVSKFLRGLNKQLLKVSATQNNFSGKKPEPHPPF